MDAVYVSIGQAANDQVSALGQRKAVNCGVKTEKFAIAA